MKNGGYAIISHDDVNIFNKVDNAYNSGKPILFYDDDKTCFFVDSVKLNGDGDYEFTKGGKTWTVTDNNTLSSEGQIQNHLYSTSLFFVCKDSDAKSVYCSLNINTKEKYDISTLTITDVFNILNEYNGTVIIGYAEFDNEKYVEMIFNFDTITKTINEISFDNGSTSTNAITTLTSGTSKSISLF